MTKAPVSHLPRASGLRQVHHTRRRPTALRCQGPVAFVIPLVGTAIYMCSSIIYTGGYPTPLIIYTGGYPAPL